MKNGASLIFLVLALVGGEAAQSQVARHSAAPEFRWLAKDMLESLEKPSCTVAGLQPPAGFQRAELLKPEKEAVEAFQGAIEGTPAQFHFDVAKADAAFELAKREGCWAEYNDLQVAQRNLKMTREDVRRSLARMTLLAPSLSQPVRTDVSAANGVEFRALVRDLIRTSRPRCRQTVKADNESVLGPARTAVRQFRSRLSSKYSPHFDIAARDVEYFDSISNVECDDPSHKSPSKLSREFLEAARRQIAAIQQRFLGSR